MQGECCDSVAQRQSSTSGSQVDLSQVQNQKSVHLNPQICMSRSVWVDTWGGVFGIIVCLSLDLSSTVRRSWCTRVAPRVCMHMPEPTTILFSTPNPARTHNFDSARPGDVALSTRVAPRVGKKITRKERRLRGREPKAAQVGKVEKPKAFAAQIASNRSWRWMVMS